MISIAGLLRWLRTALTVQAQTAHLHQIASSRKSLSKSRALRPKLEPLEDRCTPASFAEFLDPNPAPGNLFGARVVPLSTGNVVVTSPGDDYAAPDAGAVYLFNGATGALISTLRGSSSADQIGNSGIVALPGGNFLILSPDWANGDAARAGAVTFVNGRTGLNGSVAPINSLVGSQSNDFVGNFGVTVLTTGNYVVNSPNWANGTATNAGAVTFGSKTTGVVGVVSASNSLVGSQTADSVGGDGVVALPNGNYVVVSSQWSNGTTLDAGAVTFASGTTGIKGAVSLSNSLIGSQMDDQVGSGGVTIVGSSNYVIVSADWSNAAASKAGAVTWASGTTGVRGVVSVTNSLVGSQANDRVGGTGVVVLQNGNFVVRSSEWANGAMTQAGAVTFGTATAGVRGVVSVANSLVGASTADYVGDQGVVALSNGNFVVVSAQWDNGHTPNVGGVTFGSGTTGVRGVINAANSLIGAQADDFVGSQGVTALSNGNYVVASPAWANGAVLQAGAVTFGNGTIGIRGVVAYTNSLVGAQLGDAIGSNGVAALSNGNYVVLSPNWANGTATQAGAVTFANGLVGLRGVVGVGNSLVGSQTADQVGNFGIVRVGTGNYVVLSPFWANGSATNAGAVTFGSGTLGVAGLISDRNSLIGSQSNDFVGNEGVTVLTNGNYLVRSPFWTNGPAVNAGAVTFGNGTSGVRGVVAAANSLVGTQSEDRVGSNGVTALGNGNYVVVSPNWANGAATRAGAATFGNGKTGIFGAVSDGNSLVGSKVDDQVGSRGVTLLPGNNYTVLSPHWCHGVNQCAGAMTFGRGDVGIAGVVDTVNSVFGECSLTGLQEVAVDTINKTFFGCFVTESGGRVRRASQTSGLASLTATLTTGLLTITDVAGKIHNDITVRVLGTNLVITDAAAQFLAAPAGGILSNGFRTLTIPLSRVTAGVRFNTAGGNDSVTVDHSTGLVRRNVSFNGATHDGADRLRVIGGAFTTLSHAMSNANSGQIVIAGVQTIGYTAIEAVYLGSTVGSMTVTMPASINQAVLQDDDSPGDTLSRLRSANNTFVTTTFAAPTTSFSLQRGNAADAVAVTAAMGLTSSLLLGRSTAPLGGVRFSGGLTLGETALLEIFANRIDFNTTETITTGGTQRYFGPAHLAATTTLVAEDIVFGRNIDTAGQTLSVNVRGQNSQALGVISGAGQLHKAGAGTFSLMSMNTYTGRTTIDAGTLRLVGAVRSDVTINSQGTLGGSGSITGTVSGAGTINPGTATQMGILTINGSLLSVGGIHLDLAAPYLIAGVDYDQIVVNGSGNVVDLRGSSLSLTSNGGGSAPTTAPTLIRNNTGTATLPPETPGPEIVTLGNDANARKAQIRYNSGSTNHDVTLGLFSLRVTVTGATTKIGWMPVEVSVQLLDGAGQPIALGGAVVSIRTSLGSLSGPMMVPTDSNGQVSFPRVVFSHRGRQSIIAEAAGFATGISAAFDVI